jgi:hypothetical protein
VSELGYVTWISRSVRFRNIPCHELWWSLPSERMARFPHGATRRPPHDRPTNGYGRPTRPGPTIWAMPAEMLDAPATDLDTVITRLTITVDLVLEEAGAH